MASRNMQSRRSFLKLAGTAGLSVVSLAGTAAFAGAQETTGALGSRTARVDEVAFDEECDILIVGAGDRKSVV